MDKYVIFTGVCIIALLLASDSVLAQTEDLRINDMFSLIWDSLGGTVGSETTTTIESRPVMETGKGDSITELDIATQEGTTTSLPYHETREGRKFEVVPVQDYEVPIYSEWSLVSTPYQLVNETVDSFFEKIEGEWNILQTHSKDDCKEAEFYWCKNKVGTPLPEQIGKISNHKSYWVNSSSEGNITATGIHYYKQINIGLYKANLPYWSGWNMLGYPRNASVSVESLLLDSLSDNWTLFETYQGGEWLYAIEETPEPLRDMIWTLHNVTPGEGYYIKMVEDDTLVIPETARPY